MFLLLVIAQLLALAAGASIGTKIVNGDVAGVGELPWQLSLQLDESHICGAVAISEDYVLTAAHCVDFSGYSPDRFSFVCGLHNINDPGQRGVATEIIKHEQYDSNALGFPNDIAVVKVSPAFVFDGTSCQRALLPRDNEKSYELKEGIISGWGRLAGGAPAATVLKKAHLSILRNAVCERDYMYLGIFTYIRGTHICIKDLSQDPQQGACNGDSGGPLTTTDVTTGNQKVVGLTSFGRAGCDVNYASVYTRVSSYLSWIQSKMT